MDIIRRKLNIPVLKSKVDNRKCDKLLDQVILQSYLRRALQYCANFREKKNPQEVGTDLLLSFNCFYCSNPNIIC